MNYYNEIDPFVAAWIRNLIAAKLIPYGEVDERSIEDIAPAELRGYTQCHFFAGIAGWSLALRLADIPADFPIWTGSCPCQPFSTAGEGAGFADERHLWPSFQWLIAQCRPAIVVGEQVASHHVDPWIDLVLTDLEALGYTSAAVAFPSAGVGAPHIRDRTYWLGYTDNARLEGLRSGHHAAQRQREESLRSTAASGGVVRMAYPNVETAGARRRPDGENSTRHESRIGPSGCREALRGGTGPINGFWNSADWLHGRDAKWRPVEPGTFPLADGIPSRMGRLRAYGNAINPHQAAEFLKAALL